MEEVEEKIIKLTNKIEELEVKNTVNRVEKTYFLQDNDKLSKLYELGVIDSDGEYIENR